MALTDRLGWWRTRSPRERTMIGVMAILVVAALAWLLILRPLWAARADVESRLNAAVTDLAQLRAQTAAQRPAEATAAAPSPIDAFLTQAAAEAGFANATVTAQGPTRAAVTIPAAAPPAFLTWLGTLEQRGIIVDTIAIRANSDQSVGVQATLKARGS